MLIYVIWGGVVGLLYVFSVFNELLFFFSVIAAIPIRFMFQGQLCSGDEPDFIFDATLPLRGEFLKWFLIVVPAF